MPRLHKLDIDIADADADGIADDLGTGTSWSSSGDAEWLATSAGDGLAHQLVVTTAGNEASGNDPNLTLVGTDADGNAITDTVDLPDASTVETTKYFATVTSATADAATVGTMDIGWVDEVASKTIRLNRHGETGALVHVDITGTINLDIQVTADDIQANYTEQESVPWIDTGTTSLVGVTSNDAIGNIEAGATAMRVVVNSHSSGAEAQVYVSEPA